MSTEYIFTYYDALGIGEPARFILAYGGANWKDNRIAIVPPGNIYISDDIKARLRFGQVPLLEFEDKCLCQSQTIFRFLAQKFNLTGKDDFEAAQCDEIVDTVRDAHKLFMAAFHANDVTKKAEALKTALETARTRYFPKFAEIIESNGGYIVGQNLTWADIFLACLLENLANHVADLNVANDFPVLARLTQTVLNAPGIKEYVANRPVTPW